VSQFDPNTPGNRLQPVAGSKENGAGADIDFAEGVPIPPNVRPVVILSSSDSQGQLLATRSGHGPREIHG
jgi:hypothetical protein